MLLTALSNGEAIILIVFVAVPVAALSYLGVGAIYKEIGKGAFAMEHDLPQKGGAPRLTAEQREAEIRQLVEAKAYRRAARGGAPVDVEAEVERLLRAEGTGSSLRGDAQLVAEVRQLVKASNERRIRMGREPLDVEAELERQLRELENLGQ